MKNLFLLLITMLTISLAIVIQPLTSSANSAEFSVRAILPENQRTKDVSYFDLQLAPTNETVLQIEITNHSSIQKTYEIDLNAATTNMNGVINYGSLNEGEKKDSSLKINFSKIASTDPIVSIESGETKNCLIYVTMPDEIVNGVILGGITVFEVEEADAKKKQQITNRFSYSIGVLLAQSEERQAIALDLKGINVFQENRQNLISAHIQNSSPRIVNNLNLDTKIYRKNQKKPLFHREATGLRMAPNSNFNFSVETNQQALQAGQYRMVTKAYVEDEMWEWSEEFEISSEKAKNLNETAIDLEENKTQLYLSIALTVIALLSLFIVIIVLVFIWK